MWAAWGEEGRVGREGGRDGRHGGMLQVGLVTQCSGEGQATQWGPGDAVGKAETDPPPPSGRRRRCPPTCTPAAVLRHASCAGSVARDGRVASPRSTTNLRQSVWEACAFVWDGEVRGGVELVWWQSGRAGRE
eukprot:359133-Chlamydomonas_euryale.AAC.1